MSTSYEQLREHRQGQMTPESRAEYDQAYAETGLALELAQLVYDARVGAGLTQTELARRMGTSQSAIARMEAGGALPTVSTLSRLALAIGKHLRLSVEDEPPTSNSKRATKDGANSKRRTTAGARASTKRRVAGTKRTVGAKPTAHIHV